MIQQLLPESSPTRANVSMVDVPVSIGVDVAYEEASWMGLNESRFYGARPRILFVYDVFSTNNNLGAGADQYNSSSWLPSCQYDPQYYQPVMP